MALHKDLGLLLDQWRWPILLALVSVVVIVRPIVNRRKRNPRGLPPPPGPKRLPVFGNHFQLNKGHQWLVYNEWAKEFGDIIYLEALGQPTVILNTLPRALDLLEKRSTNYADRPLAPTFHLINLLEWNFGMMNYGADWRTHRRVFHQFFQQSVVRNYHPIIEQQTLSFLRRLGGNPKNFLAEAHHLFGGIIMQVAYGVSDFEYNQKVMHFAAALVQGFSDAAVPGRYLVNIFPVLRHVPEWLPGAGWKQKLEEIGSGSRSLISSLFSDALERSRNGTQSEYPNVASQLIEALPPADDPNYAEQIRIARNISVNSYVAGSDTTVSSGHAMFFALATHPEVQRKAQEEIERVVGKARLPKPADLAQMPYIQAVVKELSRWHSVAPLGLPHVLKEDDEYEGYFFSKGTIFLANTWAIMHDPKVFEDPLEFKPERYLKDGKINPKVLDPLEVAAFGYGRRICPGRYLSNDALAYMTVAVLAVFDIRPPKDESGNPRPMKLEVAADLLGTPQPFECEIVPRSAEHAALYSEVF